MKYFTFILLLGTFYSFAPADANVFELSKWLPDGFDTRKTVLLVENFKAGTTKVAANVCAKANNELKVYMQANYPYKFEFADGPDIEKNSKYSDKDKYRYVLVDDNGSTIDIHTSAGVTTQNRAASNAYHIYDRKLGKHYPDTSRPWSYLLPVFRPTVTAIVKYLKGLKG